jgi:hypothetical protein
MSGKAEKKLRQLARRKTNKELEDLITSIQKQIDDIRKPAPAWIPNKVWRWMGRQFLNI